MSKPWETQPGWGINKDDGWELPGKYRWYQTENEISLTVFSPAGRTLAAKELDVQLHREWVSVTVKGSATPLVKGTLFEPVEADNAWWQMEKGNVEIWLPKPDKNKWWASAFHGEAVIDVSSIEGSRHLDANLLNRLRREHNEKLDAEEAASASSSSSSSSSAPVADAPPASSSPAATEPAPQ